MDDIQKIKCPLRVVEYTLLSTIHDNNSCAVTKYNKWNKNVVK